MRFIFSGILLGLLLESAAMNLGKTLFAQLMDFLPWTTFTRLVNRYGGDRYVKSLTCAEQFRVMAFAQLTYRESLRDTEACLSAQSAKLYSMGFRQESKRSTLADANETRPMASGTMSTCSMSGFRKPARSMSWIVATLTSNGGLPGIRSAPSS
jgi:hypothetical protein